MFVEKWDFKAVVLIDIDLVLSRHVVKQIVYLELSGKLLVKMQRLPKGSNLILSIMFAWVLFG